MRAQGHKNLVLIDSDSNVAMFNNENVVRNLKENESNANTSTNGRVKLKAIATCEVTNLKRKSRFNKESMTNIIGLADVAEEHQITMDTKTEKAMQVRMKDEVIRFGQVRNRSHGLDPKKNNSYAHEELKREI